jgi:hypothetical protein
LYLQYWLKYRQKVNKKRNFSEPLSKISAKLLAEYFAETVRGLELHECWFFTTTITKTIASYFYQSAVLQIALTTIYMMAIFENGHLFYPSSKKIGYFLMGMFVQFISVYTYIMKEMKEGQHKFWTTIFTVMGKEQEQLCVKPKKHRISIDYRFLWKREICVCLFLDWIANILVQHLVILFIPIHLAQSAYLEQIVLNIVAAYFIVEMDNVRSAKLMFITVDSADSVLDISKRNSKLIEMSLATQITIFSVLVAIVAVTMLALFGVIKVNE